MTFNAKRITAPILAALASISLVACTGILPTFDLSSAKKSKDVPQQTVATCTEKDRHFQDISDGSTKATITQSCEETVVFIQNLHDKHPKRCRVLVGEQVTELYIMPGESRSLTQTGPVERSAVQVGCVNDWKRTK